MPIRLSQVLAVEKKIKNESETIFTKTYQVLQKPELLKGISRVYKPKQEDGEVFPSENQKVQIRAEEEIEKVSKALIDLLDVTAQKDFTNTVAKADVVVNGKVLLAGVPVPHLIFLEKKLVDIKTFISKLPVLEQTADWVPDKASSLWATTATTTAKTKKVKRYETVVQPTKEHPAQVKEHDEDIIQGHWSTIQYSGALPHSKVKELNERADMLYRAVKFAREEANTHEILAEKTGEKVIKFVFGA